MPRKLPVGNFRLVKKTFEFSKDFIENGNEDSN